jgi:hypothetical protein
MHANNASGDVSALHGLLPGNTIGGSRNQNKANLKSEMVAIQECRADLQAFLQRTRTRLQAIANTAAECCEDLTDGFGSSRILRGADGSQALKPLPIRAPAVLQRGDDMKAGAVTETLRNADAGNSADSRVSDFVPFSSLLSMAECFASDLRTSDVKASPHDTNSSRYEHKESDWRIANAFDRNTYYGPTDFGVTLDELDCSIPASLCSNVEDVRLDAFCNGTPPIEVRVNQLQSSRVLRASALHLANQIRQN